MHVSLSLHARYKVPLAWCLLTALLSAVAYWNAQHSFAEQLSRELQRLLPVRLELALQNRIGGNGPQAWIVERLEQDLATVTPNGHINLLHQCRVQVVQLVSEQSTTGTAPAQISVDWHFGDSGQLEHTQLAVDCAGNWPLLFASQGLLALLLVGGALLLPPPLTRAQRVQVRDLMRSGVQLGVACELAGKLVTFNPLQKALFARLQQRERLSPALLMDWLARPEVASLGDDDITWFELALDQAGDISGGDDPQSASEGLDRALAVARSADVLQFDCKNHRVLVRGLPIALSKTPFFYFLWYARHRKSGDGWYLNPPVNRPDKAGAESLIALMEAYGGHTKSINDLREHGLRAKTLDQNRNKIRDDLVSALGKHLAAGFLFASERDLKSGRYRYRLVPDGGLLELPYD